MDALESEYHEGVLADDFEVDQEGKCASEVITNERKKNVDSEDEDVRADTIEEDQEGKCSSEAERNKMQVAVESEFYESSTCRSCQNSTS
jgi:hypothetical protein